MSTLSTFANVCDVFTNNLLRSALIANYWWKHHKR